jgi:hypothetical protein
MYRRDGECFATTNREKEMNEAIQDIKQMLVGKQKPMELLLMLDVIAVMADKIEKLEIEVTTLRQGRANGTQKAQEGFNIG